MFLRHRLAFVLPIVTLILGWLATGPAVASPVADASEGRSAAYRDGQRALDENRLADAIAAFAAIAAAKGPEADAALYWKAYAEQRAGRKPEALRSLRELASAYPKSPWLDDAQALEVDLGAAPRPDSADEELKLYAVDALLQVDPERALPILEKVLAGSGSLKVKERALFVLSQSDAPRARDLLLATARDGEPEALRLQAVRVLGISGEAADIQVLLDIYRSQTSPAVRRQVLEALMIAGEEKALAEAARTESDLELKQKAVEMLGVMGAEKTLRELWRSERDPAVRAKLVEAFAISGNVDALREAAKSEADAEVRRRAIEGLGIAGGEPAGRALVEIYRGASERGDREAAITGLMIQGNEQALLELFRQEKDPELKRRLLQHLSLTGGDAVTDELVRLLEEKP